MRTFLQGGEHEQSKGLRQNCFTVSYVKSKEDKDDQEHTASSDITWYSLRSALVLVKKLLILSLASLFTRAQLCCYFSLPNDDPYLHQFLLASPTPLTSTATASWRGLALRFSHCCTHGVIGMALNFLIEIICCDSVFIYTAPSAARVTIYRKFTPSVQTQQLFLWVLI